ncbi:hypothetical protein [Sphingobium sp.]|uniref:hypothetical protein n=1 Tax=Sphingobium sp. TaxID=1912891 RepID=UPI003B3B4D10
MTLRPAIIDIAVRLSGAALLAIACLIGRAQDAIKSRSFPDDPSLIEWLATIGCVAGLCAGSVILLSGARLFGRR